MEIGEGCRRRDRGCLASASATSSTVRAGGRKVVIADLNDELGEQYKPRSVARAPPTSPTRPTSTTCSRAHDTYGHRHRLQQRRHHPPEDDSILDTELDAWDKVQLVNLTSVYLCAARRCCRTCSSRSPGSIINTASFRGRDGRGDTRRSRTRRPRVLVDDPRARGAVRSARASGSTRCAPARSTPRHELFAKDAEGPRAAFVHAHGPLGRARRRWPTPCSPPTSRAS